MVCVELVKTQRFGILYVSHEAFIPCRGWKQRIPSLLRSKLEKHTLTSVCCGAERGKQYFHRH